MAKLPEDATIAGILDRLDNPKDYVLEVWRNMKRVLAHHESVVVRIGVTGDGRHPHYQIDPGDRTMALLNKLMSDGTDAKRDERLNAKIDEYHVFLGSNHEEVRTWDRASVNWSTRHMTLDEVETLLDRMRGIP